MYFFPFYQACVDVLHAVAKEDKKAVIEALNSLKTTFGKMKETLGDLHSE